MIVSLPSGKVDRIISQCKWLLDKTLPTVREVAQVSGLLVSSFGAVKYMKLFYRSLEFCKSTLLSTGASYDSHLSLTPRACLDSSGLSITFSCTMGCPLHPLLPAQLLNVMLAIEAGAPAMIHVIQGPLVGNGDSLPHKLFRNLGGLFRFEMFCG